MPIQVGGVAAGEAGGAKGATSGGAEEVFFFEDILHEAGAFMDLQRAIVCRHNHAAALLAAVLEGLEGEECETGRLLYSVDSKDAAFFV